MDRFVDIDRQFNDDGSLTVTLKVHDLEETDWLLSVILSFGDHAEIVEPSELRSRFKEKLGRMLKRYT
jgi:predicted DNA-binding transcriptional regulator YafY